jgi:hypothetical protein
VVGQQKDTPGTVAVLTPIALGAIRLRAVFHDLDTLTLGTPRVHHSHDAPPPGAMTKGTRTLSQQQLN